MSTINAVFFLSEDYVDLLGTFLDFSDGLLIPCRIFSVDGSGGGNLHGHPVTPIEKVAEMLELDFSRVVLFTEFVDHILRILDKVCKRQYDVVSPDKIYPHLKKSGRMEYFRKWIRTSFPRKDLPYVEIGEYTYFSGMRVENFGREGNICRIGKFCSIADGLTVLLSAEHETKWNTTYPFDDYIYISLSEQHSFSKGDVIIGNDVWIGMNATILSGVTIGDGSIIGAAAVVAKDVEPYSIVVGNPGREIKKRFPPETINKLQEIRWWNWKPNEIYDAIPLLQSENIEGLYRFWQEHIKK